MSTAIPDRSEFSTIAGFDPELDLLSVAAQGTFAVEVLPIAAAPSGEGSPRPSREESVRPGTTFPKAGETVLDFELVREVGRGTFGRVFLARQQGLAGRPVAVKFTVDAEDETQTLARLQHTNIMPIFSGHRHGRFRVVCMPWFGGTTFADVCGAVRGMAVPPQSGACLASTLESRRTDIESPDSCRSSAAPGTAAKAETPRTETEVGSLHRLRSMPFSSAVLWLVARVADGLQHAHERGILHRDLKPANVLLADDGQPLLLDFNLADDADNRPADAQARAGGTIPYMSPEQLESFAGTGATVDARSDVWALGLLLYELLTGKMAFEPHKGAPGEILPRLLADRRASPPSIPRSSPSYSPSIAAIVGHCLEYEPGRRYPSAAAVAEDIDRHLADRPLKYAGNPSLRERFRKWVRRNPSLVSPMSLGFGAAGAALLVASVLTGMAISSRRAEAARMVLAGDEIVRTFDADRDRAELLHAALPEHRATRPLLEKALEPFAGSDWSGRPEFAHLGGPEVERLRGRTDELNFLAGRATDLPGTDRLAGLVGATHLHSGEYRQAVTVLSTYLRHYPDDASGWFRLGRAYLTLGEPDEALRAFERALRLRPKFGAGHLLRAYAADALNLVDRTSRVPEAILDCDTALKFDPDLAEAKLFRASVRIKKGFDLGAARADLDALLSGESPPPQAYFLRSRLRGVRMDPDGAADDLKMGMTMPISDAAGLVARGFARLKSDPEAAMADFAAAEKLTPTAIDPLVNQIYLAGETLHDPMLAVAACDRLLRAHPEHVQGLCFRAIYLARAGRTEDAVAMVPGILKISPVAFTQYRVGCVFAIAAKSDPKRFAAPAIRHLAAAIRGGHGYEFLEIDTDLDALRALPEFRPLAESVARIQRSAAPTPPAPDRTSH